MVHNNSQIISWIYVDLKLKPISFPMAQQPLVGQGLLIIDKSSQHKEIYLKNKTLTTYDVYATGGIRTRKTSKREHTEPRLITHGSLGLAKEDHAKRI
jgi:hypothetical protein